MYMSPEQCLGLGDVDARSDIYSFGVVLYEMTSGKMPFEADSMYRLLGMHINDQPVPPSHYRKGLPHGIEDIIMQALAKNPAERQGSMAEVLSQLELARGNVLASNEALKRSRMGGDGLASPSSAMGRDEVVAWLHEIDRLLVGPVGIQLVGTSAALLGYGAQTPIRNLKILSPIPEEILRASDLATTKFCLRPDSSPVPSGYSDTCQRLDLGLHKLTVWVPDRYRLLLMMASEGAREDLRFIEEMHSARPFDIDVMVECCNDSNQYVYRNVQTLERVCLIIERLFGPNRAHIWGIVSTRIYAESPRNP
jgi:hypothetical protein